MKRHFDEKAVPRSLQTGDQVLVLLPIPGSSLSARFSGPYCVGRKLSDTDYVIQTPDRRRKSRICLVNMLKLYHVNTLTTVFQRLARTSLALHLAKCEFGRATVTFWGVMCVVVFLCLPSRSL